MQILLVITKSFSSRSIKRSLERNEWNILLIKTVSVVDSSNGHSNWNGFWNKFRMTVSVVDSSNGHSNYERFMESRKIWVSVVDPSNGHSNTQTIPTIHSTKCFSSRSIKRSLEHWLRNYRVLAFVSVVDPSNGHSNRDRIFLQSIEKVSVVDPSNGHSNRI